MRTAAWSLAVWVSFASGVSAAELRGAGASAPDALLQEWAREYGKAKGAKVLYEATGSGEGIRRIKAGEVAFAASDVALSVPELQGSTLVQFPVALGGIVPVVNIPGVAKGSLRLTGALLADVMRGRIQNWNAPEVAKANPNLSLPDLPIKRGHRGDKSGSTAVMTSYLSRVSADWKSSIGSGLQVAWPAGSQACEGSDGVVEFLAKTPGAISYVDFSRVKSRDLSGVQLENRAKKFVAPSKAGFQAAAIAFPWAQAPAFSVVLVDQPGAESWPVTSAVFVLMRLNAEPEISRDVLRFFEWALEGGAAAAERLSFIPLPAPVAQTVRAGWSRQFKEKDGKPLAVASLY